MEALAVKEFTDLKVWQEAHKLTLVVYTVTQKWPREEMFGLTGQVRRSASSVEANIAEGHGRFGNSEFHQFCSIARGSLAEVQCHLMLARDLGYLTPDEWQSIHEQTIVVRQLLQGFMRHLRGE
jgi:four helix bundle protein